MRVNNERGVPMFTTASSKTSNLTTGSKNWEADINYVSVKPCDATMDPLCYQAIFHAEENGESAFAVGASFLAQRELNLHNAGFLAPMTTKAIALIEEQLGTALRFTQKSFA